MSHKKKADILPEDTPEITRELTCILRKLLDDDQFVSGTLNCACNIERQAVLLDYIKRGSNVTYSSVAVLAFKLSCYGVGTKERAASAATR